MILIQYYVSGLETIEGVNEDKGPLVMHINPLTYVVTADKTVLASSAFGYHNLSYAGTGTYDTCTGTYTMIFDILRCRRLLEYNHFIMTRN